MKTLHRTIAAVAAVAALLVGGSAEARGHHYGSHQSRSYSYHPSRRTYHSSWGGSAYYTNVSGHRVHRPVYSSRAPAHASAHCADGSWSFSEHARGTCSHHGGVASWR